MSLRDDLITEARMFADSRGSYRMEQLVDHLLERFDLRTGEQVDDLIAKWSGCWCEEQTTPEHDPRVRDCPQHGSDDCRHMAEGIALDLSTIRSATPSGGSE